MKFIRGVLPFLFLATLFVLPAAARDLAPIVSAEWLEKNLSQPGLKVIDIRKVEEYREGHVPGAINVFYGAWAVKRNNMDNELPADDDLQDVVAGAGITPASKVVVVGSVETTSDMVNNTRVAWTLRYAGIADVAVLDGGYAKWIADKRQVSKEAPARKAAEPSGKINRAVMAQKEDVKKAGSKTLLIDTRNPEFFFGTTKLPFVDRAGHLKGAVNLPSSWIFTKDGTFKATDELQAMVEGVVGKDRNQELIVYCDTGRLASGWWWLLSEMFGYGKVKLYDGSSQEFSRDQSMLMDKFTWK